MKTALLLNEQSFSGCNVLIQGIKSGVSSVPLHIIDVQSSLISGPVMVGIVTSLPVSIVSDDVGAEMSEVIPACSVARAMARLMEAVDKPGEDQQSDLVHSQAVMTVLLRGLAQLTREQLINNQQADPELQAIAQHAGEEHYMRDSPVSYFMKNRVLMRKWRSHTVPASDEWEIVYQVVVPRNCHAEVINLAHSTP